MTFDAEGHYEISEAEKKIDLKTENDIHLSERVEFSKEIAGHYVAPLLSEGILKVTRDHIQIMSLVIPRDRVVLFHIALCQLRHPDEYYPIRQGKRGFTVEKVSVAHGNDVFSGYKVTSNADDRASVILTKKLAWELWEVVAFFIPKPDYNGMVTPVDTDDDEGIE